jgi:hypothetical protein
MTRDVYKKYLPVVPQGLEWSFLNLSAYTVSRLVVMQFANNYNTEKIKDL